MTVCAILLSLGYSTSEPLINVLPHPREPEWRWRARVARAYQHSRDEWRGPLLSPRESERRLLSAELRAYAHVLDTLQHTQNCTTVDRTDIADCFSNYAAVLHLTTNEAALSAYLVATGHDKPLPWRPWLCFVLLITVPFGLAAGAFLFCAVRFVRRLIA